VANDGAHLLHPEIPPAALRPCGDRLAETRTTVQCEQDAADATGNDGQDELDATVVRVFCPTQVSVSPSATELVGTMAMMTSATGQARAPSTMQAAVASLCASRLICQGGGSLLGG